ncbi:transposase [Pseudomonas sp. GD03858]|uniref:REP-associated tyrosine transposase n=1 Tax=unclassified Pseudomonas TaxID=196821 RepID=UPI00244824A8|nr:MULTISPECIES: transposase [unclassified Pseudomonas]MDH0646826.1 transposase [Pseudomonas sp. GD03867]MDH0662529.1 transposase [Pseudomonas sp. GD03858]
MHLGPCGSGFTREGASAVLCHIQKPSTASHFVPTATVQQRLISKGDSNACRSLAWVVMPDHLHWLIELRLATLCTLMRRFKSRSSLELHKAGVGHHPIWQAGYQDHALRREENAIHIARYIVANPLRARLVNNVREYPHWDAVWL